MTKDPGIFENVDPLTIRPNDRVRIRPHEGKPRIASVESVEHFALINVVTDKGKRYGYDEAVRFDLIIGDYPHPDDGPLSDPELRSLEIWPGPHGAKSVLQRAADEIKSLRAALYRCEADKGDA
jgi:hypothetical protein